jgi:hypothetical protein
MQLLVDQEHETLRLRRALYTAAERIDTEAQRVRAMEQANIEATERFRMLNDSRVAAQQEAMKASQELRLYQFQLETAQSEIDRAQETLKLVRRQKEEAEEAAARARTQARLLHQERVIALAREEGRKDGFEAGFKRAQREQSLSVKQSGVVPEGRHRGHRKVSSHPESLEAAAYNRTQMEAAFQSGPSAGIEDDQLSRVSSPSRLPLRGLGQNTSPEIIRVAQPELQPPTYHTQSQPPRAELRYERPPPPEPVPIVHIEPDVSRPHTPSIQVYSLDIPPTAQLQKDFPPNESPIANSQWVTARQHLEMNGHNPSQDELHQYSAANADLPRGSNSMSQPVRPPTARKESWIRTLSRRALGFRRKAEPQNRPVVDPPTAQSRLPQQQSWYKPNPPVLVRDYGLPPSRAHSSIDDNASMSTRMSQLDLVSPPNHTPNGSVSASGRSGKVGGRFKEKKTGLFVINEDPLSRENTPVKESWQTNGKRVDRDDMHSPIQQQSSRGQQEPRYSDPKAVEAWRRSGTTNSRDFRDMVCHIFSQDSILSDKYFRIDHQARSDALRI